MRERHNKILERTAKAIPPSAGDRFVEQTISGSPFDLRPDIICINASERTATIIDITVPFEWSPEALQAARDEKERKYGPLAEWLKEEMNLTSVSMEALVVGARGAWDPKNSAALRGPSTSAEDSLFSTKSCAPPTLSLDLKPSGR